MTILRRVREFVRSTVEMWSQVLVGELIALNKPRTDFRR